VFAGPPAAVELFVHAGLCGLTAVLAGSQRKGDLKKDAKYELAGLCCVTEWPSQGMQYFSPIQRPERGTSRIAFPALQVSSSMLFSFPSVGPNAG
jgi:hypothetical protein